MSVARVVCDRRDVVEVRRAGAPAGHDDLRAVRADRDGISPVVTFWALVPGHPQALAAHRVVRDGGVVAPARRAVTDPGHHDLAEVRTEGERWGCVLGVPRAVVALYPQRRTGRAIERDQRVIAATGANALAVTG